MPHLKAFKFILIWGLFHLCLESLRCSILNRVPLPKTICSLKAIQADTISRQQRQTDLTTLTGIYKQNKMWISFQPTLLKEYATCFDVTPWIFHVWTTSWLAGRCFQTPRRGGPGRQRRFNCCFSVSHTTVQELLDPYWLLNCFARCQYTKSLGVKKKENQIHHGWTFPPN